MFCLNIFASYHNFMTKYLVSKLEILVMSLVLEFLGIIDIFAGNNQ